MGESLLVNVKRVINIDTSYHLIKRAITGSALGALISLTLVSQHASGEPACAPRDARARTPNTQPQSTTARSGDQETPSACLGLDPSKPAPRQLNAQGQEMNAPHTKNTLTNREKSPRGARNVLGEPLHQCCTSPLTGFERDGFCHTGPHDRGVHVVCAQMTEDFLAYTRAQGNDLSTPIPAYGFPGLKPGDRWCLCAARWAQAERAGVAPLIDLDATQEKALEFVSLELLQKYALKRP